MANNSVRKNRNQFHIPPKGIDRNASFFITINCKTRGSNQLAREVIFKCICEACGYYTSNQKWLPEIILVMPDHIHAIASFPWGNENQMSALIRNFKRYTARSCGIEWQRDFFDHRIRSESDHHEKWTYITQNPVRAGLVDEPDEWFYVWRP